MNSPSNDSSTGWLGLAIGGFFIAIASPVLVDMLQGQAPALAIRHVVISGNAAIVASAICVLIGLGFIGAGLWRFLDRRA